jgi:hypothetical protein
MNVAAEDCAVESAVWMPALKFDAYFVCRG